MPRNLDLTLLRTFAAVADYRSMTIAGRALHLTQGAVSLGPNLTAIATFICTAAIFANTRAIFRFSGSF
jgi:Bacterial regulatory helix-turn-helix protein, lysR family